MRAFILSSAIACVTALTLTGQAFGFGCPNAMMPTGDYYILGYPAGGGVTIRVRGWDYDNLGTRGIAVYVNGVLYTKLPGDVTLTIGPGTGFVQFFSRNVDKCGQFTGPRALIVEGYV